ncbi:hypothetical protein K450DRAFT_231474 [Umbelopsis ramanniana AG]|uniref:DNA replication checkpoint mediator MRC1 domain-containing protein n=1 Tax=Umbelopsis ramanniana AG TaxID=1314678 RepID=A0AAD5HEI3_UMBRA|nr:uncharacterized protein K450DRAFT_231474 [Umbelopsis ramanniana AG]KAI8581475.1 hypothetical protein K450DRAFT_231474 [Umbelopsis ramanniana AG]
MKEKGLYTSAEELARKHLDREKEAQSIHEEVERMQAKTLKPNAKNYTDQSGGEDSDADDSYGSEKEDWEDDSGSDKDQFADSEDDEIEIDHANVPASPAPARKNRRIAVISDDESDEDVTPTREASSSPIQSVQYNDVQKPSIPRQPIRSKAVFKKNDFVENEAEEEEDEYMGLGGVDGEDDGPDEYVEDDVVVHANDEELDEAQLRQAYNNQVADSDQNMIQRLIKDVVSGGLRRRRGAMNDGYELDYYDTFDDMDDNLVALRRAAAAKRRKLLNGNILQAIAENPQTAAFAKASKVDIDEDEKPSFSDGEEEESQPIPVNDDGQDDEDESDDEHQVSTFSETLAAMKQSSINEEVETVMEEVSVFTEEPISNDVEEDTWSSVTVSHRKVTKKQFTSPLQTNRVRSSPLFRSPGKLQKFKTLLQEAGGSIGGSSETGSHVGFSAPSRAKEDRSASVSSQRSNSSSTSASQESYTTLSRKNSRLLDILSSQESSIA